MKALLPVWSVVVLAVVATTAGAAVADAGAPWWLAVLVAFALSPGVVFVLRRVLPRFGAPAYDELPESYYGYRRFGHELVSDLLNRFVPVVAGVLAGVPALLLGIGTEPAAWEIPAWILCGFATGWPVYTEIDARYRLRIDRQNAREETAMLDGAEREAAAIGTGTVEIPLRRSFLVAFGLLGLAMAALCAVVVVGADDDPVARVLCAPGIPLFAFAAFRMARDLRAPYFARLDEDAIDVLGRDTVPWSAVEGVELASTRGLRMLEVTCRGRADVSVMVRAAAWPPERVLGALKAHGVRELDVSLA